MMVRSHARWFCTFLILLGAPLSVPARGETKKFALLVGCTAYKNLNSNWKLQGPANDVPLWAKMLKEKFNFEEKNISVLVDGAKEAGRLPTYDNIVAGFEDLIKKADENTQIVILLSGHGSQIPIPETQLDPLDPRNPEPDGLDEIFLPTDIRMSDKGLEGYIIDDKIGAWLDRFRDKGAAVWIIFDCCHSGTMDRGGPGDVERSREIKAADLGVPVKAIEAAARRGAEAVRKAKEKGKIVTENSPLMLSPTGKNKKGSVIALYAAQSFEPAPELPRPPDAPRTKDNYYGLLSYTLIKVLEQQGSKLTYRELQNLLVGQYAAERGSRGPTPFFEGDLDREVLGAKTWPNRSRIAFSKEKMELNAGELSGLTRGSILALERPVVDKDAAKAIVLGYVQVSDLTPTSAKVISCKYADKEAVAADQLPAKASAKLVSRDFGDMKITYAIVVPDGAQAKRVAQAMQSLDKDVGDMVKEVPVAEAEWLLVVKDGKLQLRHGEGRPLDADKANQITQGNALARVCRVYETCSLDDTVKQIAASLSRDLARVFTWQSLWRISGSAATAATAKESNLGLLLEVTKIKDKQPDGSLVSGAPVAPGQKVRISLKNTGFNDVRVTLLFLDGDFGINSVNTSIKAGEEMRPLPGHIDGKTTGKEGIIVLASVLAPNQPLPDYSFLNQPALKIGRRAVLDVSRGPSSPFGDLLRTARLGKGTRSFVVEASDNPIILTWSWVAVNPVSVDKR